MTRTGPLLLLLAVYGAILLAFQGSVTVFEDEVIIVAGAGARSAGEIAGGYLRGQEVMEHPPLYDLVLHAWIRATGGSVGLLRLPSVLFYVAGLLLLGAACARLGGCRRAAVAIGALWPASPFVALPAHWAALVFLAECAVLWSYLAWRDGGRRAHLAALAVSGAALLWSSYFGVAILGVIAVHLVLSRPGRRALGSAAVAAAVMALAFLPLLPAFVRQVTGGTRLGRSAAAMAADAAYHGWSLLLGEAVAPWTPRAAVAAIGVLGILVALARTRRVYGWAAVGAALFAAGVAGGFLNGKRLVIFAPFLLLTLALLWQHAIPRRWPARAAIALAFGTGWFGVLAGGSWGTYRYVEPWREVAADVAARVRPGDVVLCQHPSFWFRMRAERGWTDWARALPGEAFEDGGVVFTTLADWEGPVTGAARVVHVRTVVNPEWMEEQERAASTLDAMLWPVTRRAFLEDRASALKNRFVGNQPRFRIELSEYERPAP